MTSWNVSRSNERPATISFGRAFSSSRCFIRRISSGSSLPYEFLRLE